MTTDRRRARALAGRDLTVDGHQVPAELLDPDDPVWSTPEGAEAFALRHRLAYLAPAGDRYSARGTHPQDRRNHAAMAWATSSGVTLAAGESTDRSHPDLHRLRAMGLYGSNEPA